MGPSMQSVLTAIIVGGSAGYASWALMPAAWRAAIHRRLGRAPAPVSGCSGCGGGCAAPPGAVAAPRTAIVRVHRRPKAG